MDYSYVLAQAVTEMLLSLPPTKRTSLSDLFNSLALNPFQEAEVVDYDHVGRPLNVYMDGPWLITYWVDHVEREVRIVDAVTV